MLRRWCFPAKAPAPNRNCKLPKPHLLRQPLPRRLPAPRLPPKQRCRRTGKAPSLSRPKPWRALSRGRTTRPKTLWDRSPLYGRWWLWSFDFYLWHPEHGGRYPTVSNDLLATLASWGIEVLGDFPRPEYVRELLAEKGVLSCVKFGATIDEDAWSELVYRCHTDPDIPPGRNPMRRRGDMDGVVVRG